MSVEAKLMTAEELLAMPDDGMKHELIGGELMTMVPPGADHGDIALRIGASLLSHVTARRLGKVYVETGYVLHANPDTVRGPDVSFVRADRVVKTRKYYKGGPDIAVEVVSPDDRFSDVKAKVREYLAAGTSVVIVVDPGSQEAWIHTASGERHLALDDALTAPDVLPGWSLPLRELFAD